MKFTILFPALVMYLCISLSHDIYAQQSTGTIMGKVIDRKNQQIEQGISIRLVETSTRTVVQQTLPESDGTFTFRHVPFATYTLHVLFDSTVIGSRVVAVRTSVPVHITIDSLREYETETIIVTAEREARSQALTGSHTIFTAASLDNLPTPSANNAVERMLLNTPGVVPDEDGRMHVRGEDAQIQYIINGIPVTGNMTRIYSSLFNAQLIKSVNIQTGSLDAQYGIATAAVLDIDTKSGFDRPLFAQGSALYGSFNTREAGVQVGGSPGGRMALFLAFNAQESDRYLDPITGSEPNHSDGRSTHSFGTFNAILTDHIDLNILGSYNTAIYSIPNGSNPQQNQVQNLKDYLLGVRLNVSTSEQSTVSVLGYRRQARAEITSGGLSRILTSADATKAVQENEKYFFGGDRMNTATGGQVEFLARTDWFDLSHNVRAGIGGEEYPLHEFFTFAVTNPKVSNSDSSGGDSRYLPYDITQGGHPFLVDQSRTGKRYSAYVQDQVQYGKWNISAGLRYDMFDLFEKESALSPRVNLAYTLNEDWVLRASYNRIAMQAPVENILVSSSQEALMLVGAEQGTTPTTVKSERAHVIELGATYFMNQYLDFDITGFGKMIDNFLVKVELGNSGVIFPANLKNGFVAGGEVRARLHDWHNFSGFLTISSCISLGLKPEDGSSPVAAGLILGEEGHNYSHPFASEDAFPTEHNQILTAVLNTTYHHESGFFGTLNGRFDFGLPFDLVGKDGKGLNVEESRAELKRRGYADDVIDLLSLEEEEPGSPDKATAPHVIFDLSAGYDFMTTFAVPIRLTASVLNVLDTPFLYKFESSFGGTHFGYPRMFNMKIETRL